MASLEVTIHIIADDVNRPPEILVPLPTEPIRLKVGETYNMAQHFVDPDGDVLQYALKELSTFIECSPEGLILAKQKGAGSSQLVVSDGKTP